MQVVIFPAAVADQLRAATAIDGDPGAALNPRPVLAGPYAGMEADDVRILTDPAFAGYAALLAQGMVVEIDATVAWAGQ